MVQRMEDERASCCAVAGRGASVGQTHSQQHHVSVARVLLASTSCPTVPEHACMHA